MKALVISSVLVLVSLIGMFVLVNTRPDDDVEPNFAYPADGIYVKLGEYHANQIELACEHGRISVRMRISHSISKDVADAASDYICQTIDSLTTGGIIPIGGYTFEFKGVWLMYRPYNLLEKGGFGYIGVEFAQGELDNRAITAYGRVTAPSKTEEYPYKNRTRL